MRFLSVDLNNVSPDHDSFNEDDPESIAHVRLLAWRNRYQRKEC